MPGERFQWLESAGTKGIADGHHIFELKPVGKGKTRFVQREEFTGWAVRLLWPAFRKAEPGFVAMNQALKEHSEKASISRRTEPDQSPAPFSLPNHQNRMFGFMFLLMAMSLPRSPAPLSPPIPGCAAPTAESTLR